jgi:hypothetical protein
MFFVVLSILYQQNFYHLSLLDTSFEVLLFFQKSFKIPYLSEQAVLSRRENIFLDRFRQKLSDG